MLIAASVLGIFFLLTLAIMIYVWATDPVMNEQEVPAPGPGLSAVEFPEQSDVIAKDHPHYRPLPVLMKSDQQSTMVTCWQLTFRDRLKLLLTGKLWATIWTFDMPIQPLYFTVNKSDVIEPKVAK